nr:alpha/beta fold hydrolase [Micromonospora sp. DSM 115978]
MTITPERDERDMSTPAIDGFTYQKLPGADGVSLNVALGGEGTPVVLLHGFPQTHLMWRDVARNLADEYHVVVPDLRGYGESDKPV